jgi:hypothetical protein
VIHKFNLQVWGLTLSVWPKSQGKYHVTFYESWEVQHTTDQKWKSRFYICRSTFRSTVRMRALCNDVLEFKRYANMVEFYSSFSSLPLFLKAFVCSLMFFWAGESAGGCPLAPEHLIYQQSTSQTRGLICTHYQGTTALFFAGSAE